MDKNNDVQFENLNKIPLSRRIAEILEERGSAFSIRAFATRIGFSKDMLARMISGERYISPTDLETISRGLSMSVARLKREDTTEMVAELEKLLKNKQNNKLALRIASELNNLAVGCTERFFASKNLGTAYFYLKRYEEAHSAWLKAREFAQRIVVRYDQSEPLRVSLSNLVLSFTERKDFAGLQEVISEVQDIFENDNYEMGTICYSCAMIAYNSGNLTITKEKLYESLQYFTLTGDASLIGKGELNVGFVEYQSGDYHKAKEYYERAIKTLADFDEVRLRATKEYVKTLMKLNDKRNAAKWVNDALVNLGTLDLPHLQSQFYMLDAIINDNKEAAERILEIVETDPSLKTIACKYLMNYYSSRGDSNNLMRYYVIAGQLSLKASVLYDEVGL